MAERVSQMVPLPVFAEAVIRANSTTPDLLYLTAKYDFLPVFMYGTEQVNFSEYEAMRHYPRIGYGFTAADDYLLYVTKDTYPVAFTNPIRNDTCRLRGELFLVPPEVIAEMDVRYTNGVFFRRTQRYVQWYLEQDKDKKEKQWFTTEAFIWHGVQGAWQERISNGEMDKMTPLRAAADQQSYYHFRNIDDKPNRIRTDVRAL